jgi:hypothetical protein
MFQTLSLAIFKDYGYFKTYKALLHSFSIVKVKIYRVIQKSLRDFRPLRYSNRDGNAEAEHVNRGRDSPSFCPTLQVHDMSTLGDAAVVRFGNFGNFQYPERFVIPCPRQVSSRLSPSGETCKYATAPSTQKKKLGDILYLLIRTFCCVFLGCCAAEFGSSGGTYELPCIQLQYVNLNITVGITL